MSTNPCGHTTNRKRPARDSRTGKGQRDAFKPGRRYGRRALNGKHQGAAPVGINRVRTLARRLPSTSRSIRQAMRGDDYGNRGRGPARAAPCRFPQPHGPMTRRAIAGACPPGCFHFKDSAAKSGPRSRANFMQPPAALPIHSPTASSCLRNLPPAPPPHRTTRHQETAARADVSTAGECLGVSNWSPPPWYGPSRAKRPRYCPRAGFAARRLAVASDRLNLRGYPSAAVYSCLPTSSKQLSFDANAFPATF